MSVLGIKALVKERNFFFPEMKIQAEKIDFELKTIEENKSALKNIRTLNLATFGKVDFRIQGIVTRFLDKNMQNLVAISSDLFTQISEFLGSSKNSPYVNTLQIMALVGFSPSFLEQYPSKSYFIVCRLLTQRGFNLDACFMKIGKSKYR